MNNLRLVPLMVFAALTPACVMDSVDNSSIAFDWEVRDVGPGGQLVACADAGVTTVNMVARNLTTATDYSFDFDCVNYGGQTPVLPSGQYAVTLRLLRADGVEVSSIALPFAGQGPITVNSRRLTYVGAIIFEIQSLQLEWEIVRPAGDVELVLSCAQAGASQVQMTAAISNLVPFVFNFPCDDHAGLTQALPVGTYNLTLQLFTPAGVPLSELSTSYTTPNQLPAILPLVTFEVN